MSASNVVSGNGKYKYASEGVKLTENDEIGTLNNSEKYPDVMLILVKLKIANTSDVDMKINEVTQAIYNLHGSGEINIPFDAIEALRESALPLTIKAGEIVERYVPLVYR